MKKFRNILLISAALVSAAGCHFLDVDPELGVTEEEVFGTYKNFRNFLYGAYDANDPLNLGLGSPMRVDMCRTRIALISTTDASDPCRYGNAHNQWKVGVLKEQVLGRYTFDDEDWTSSSRDMPIAKAMFKAIRIANMALEHESYLQNVDQNLKDDLIGQAHFIRAYAHFTLVRYFGGMPYLDKVLSGDDEWDMTRLTSWETLQKAAEDFETAYQYMKKAGTMRRDPGPGRPGNLEHEDQARPNGCAAIALKARTLLYAASPLNNTRGEADWIAAAEAAATAINECEANEYYLLPLDNYDDLFWGYRFHNEGIWNKSIGSKKANTQDFWGYFAKPQCPSASSTSGMCPTQNFVDRYETEWGDPLYPEEQRAAAKAKGHYNDQDPYSHLDPRFYKTIIFDGATTDYCDKINIYYDTENGNYPASTFSTSKGDVTSVFGQNWFSNPTSSTSSPSYTNYYLKKYWNGQLGNANCTAYYTTDNLIRMAEVYLNYAEAVNEAYGPDGKVAGCQYSAVDAVNIVRERAEMPGVLTEYKSSKDIFRERIQNERCVELAYESEHYWFDIRRWKIGSRVMNQTLYGMYIETCPVDADHPNGKRYTRLALPSERQCLWREYMYWIPWPKREVNKMKNFVNNPAWI